MDKGRQTLTFYLIEINNESLFFVSVHRWEQKEPVLVLFMFQILFINHLH